VATNFPVALDSITNPIGANTLNSPSHASQHTNANDAIEAMQAKIGVDNSAVTTSLDYKVRIGDPVGQISMWATSSAPTGWLICDGSPVSRSTYSALHTLMQAAGYPYGAGDGSTTFNLPNLKGRVVVGRDAADADWDTLGETRGSKTHTLTISEMPVHSHSTSISGSDADVVERNSGYITPSAEGQSYRVPDQWLNPVNNGMQIKAADFSHSHTASVGNTGYGTAHNNIQPSIVLNFIIRH
jgi:microcystin-dependent protein